MSSPSSASETVRRALAALAESRERGISLEAFLAERTQSEADSAAILRTLDGISRNHAEIEASGLGRSVFVAKRLQAAGAQLGPGGVLDVAGIDAVLDAGSAARATVDTVVEAAARGLHEAGGTDLELPVDAIAEASFAQPAGDAGDRALTAAIAAEVLPAARERLGPEAPFVAETVTAAVDLGVQSAKVAYQVGSGRMGVSDGLSWLLDRGAAAVGRLVEEATPVIAERGGEIVGTMIGQLVGMGPAGGQIGRQLGRLAGASVARTVGQAAKRVVEAVASSLRPAMKVVKEWGSRLLGWLG